MWSHFSSATVPLYDSDRAGQCRMTHHPKSAEILSDVAKPKSAMHTFSPLRVTRMFSGFRSRWYMPLL